jgi:hypothetical protein
LMSKPRGGNRPTRSIDMASRVLAEYQRALEKREQWARDRAVEDLQRTHQDWSVRKEDR